MMWHMSDSAPLYALAIVAIVVIAFLALACWLI